MCVLQPAEYTGVRSGALEDEMCVVVRSSKITVSDESGARFLQQVVAKVQK